MFLLLICPIVWIHIAYRFLIRNQFEYKIYIGCLEVSYAEITSSVAVECML